VVGTGVKKALFISELWALTSSTPFKLATLPGLFILPVRFKLFFLLNDCLFFKVPPLDGVKV